MYSLNALGQDPTSTPEYKNHRDTLQDVDWLATIERFHLPEEDRNAKLADVASRLFA
jgi:hypothetical protein